MKLIGRLKRMETEKAIVVVTAILCVGFISFVWSLGV